MNRETVVSYIGIAILSVIMVGCFAIMGAAYLGIHLPR